MKLVVNSKEELINNHNSRLIIKDKNEINMINMKLMITIVANSNWFHWYEGSFQPIILWYSYIGINNELMELYLSKYG